MNFIRFFIISFAFVAFSVALANEPSAFESQSGATKKDMKALKDSSQSQSDRISVLESKVKELSTALEGLNSIYAGQSRLVKEISDKSNTLDETSKDIAQLKEKVEANTKSIAALSESLGALKDSIASIQEMLSAAINENKNKQDKAKSDGESSVAFEKDTKKKSDIFKEARSLTYKKRFDEAIARYNWFIEINYKKAESNYMLGNIAYEQNRYEDAIFYYKQSATQDDKAKYMPRLLLNSANSFRVTNDSENAIKFYNSVISLFPKSPEAKDAKKQLDKLN